RLPCVPDVTYGPIRVANEFRSDGNSPCRRLFSDRNHLHVKRNWIALGPTESSHLLQIFRSVCAAHDLFEKSQLHERIVRKFNHAVMIRRCCVLEETAVSVFPYLSRFQNSRRHFQADDLALPINLVLLDVMKAIRFVIDWRAKRWRLDLFFSWR